MIVSPVAILLILSLINAINYADRQIMAPLVVLVQKPAAEGGLGLSDGQAGALQMAFMVVHSLASIPLGILADRWLRKKLIAAGVGIWSVATAGAALARGFGGLFLARAAVGIGEAAYAPAASAMISERFSPERRARALGIFQLGMVIGGAIGVVLGSIVGKHYGWRAAFLVVGLPGLLLAGLALLIREDPRGPRRAPSSPPAGSSLAIDLRHMIRSPAVVWINVSGIFITFFTGALIFWLPKFILATHYGGDEEYLDRVGTTFGILATGAGAAGVIIGSLVADRLERTRPGAGRLSAVAVGVFLSAPCAIVGFLARDAWLVYTAVGLGVFFNVWYVGPILAALHDVVPPQFRGTATGAYLLLVHLLGDAISPFIVGVISGQSSLRIGLMAATGVLLLGGVATLVAIPHSIRLAKLKRPQAAG
jgi:MFS family permease